MLPDSFFETPHTSCLCFIHFTGYLLSRASNANCLCFALRSSLIKPRSTFQSVLTFTFLPSSFALLKTPECLPSFRIKSSGQRSFSDQSPGSNYINKQKNVRHTTSVSSVKTSLKIFPFSQTFFQFLCPEIHV